ncbi:ABC transporter substrate-binding protein [Sporomusa termitida]|uniref:ABC transporter, substrate-binding protein, aliphatic sulfonates family n=1 Tax=Sporomusa termitida TaxID=2377 RepID=A0A517DPR5_9FIRM|nr:ABC transporter substrate-binding protein [Sporomusa termitida]QDR79298.1 ABC transporter, substrate-binding protein, aliphatic sulfonates family [Sporomusa termitida]
MNNKIVSLLLLLFLGFSLTGCAGSLGGSQTVQTGTVAADGKKLFPIRVAGDGTANGEVMIGNEVGFFREEGIEIIFTGALKGGATELQTIAQGINDAFIGGHPHSVAQAIMAGIKVKAVAPGMVDHPDFPHVRYLVREDSPIKTLNDIVGKKVSQTSATSACQDGYLKLHLQQNNLPLDVEWVKLPNPGQQEQALKQGLIDMTTSHPPYAGITVKQPGIRQVATSYDIVKTPGAGLSVRGFSEKFIAEHPDVVRAFCRALQKSHKWINANQQEAAAIVARKVKVDPEHVSVFWYEERGHIDPAYMDIWVKLSEDIGLWPAGSIKSEAIYTNEFAPKE